MMLSILSAGFLAGANSCTALTLISSHDAGIIVGAEDIVVDHNAGLAYISAYDRPGVEKILAEDRLPAVQGGIYTLDLRVFQNVTPNTVVVNDLTAAYKQNAQFRPHGIDLLVKDGKATTLFAVNRVYREGVEGIELKPHIDSFDITGSALHHRRTVQDDLLCSPNDVAAIDEVRFFATNDHGSCNGIDRFAEDVLGLNDSYVVYFNGKQIFRAADRIGFSNGISYHNDKLYVAATRQQAVLVYNTAGFLQSPSAPMPLGNTIRLTASPDNLSWDRDGNLLIGAIPGLFRLALYRSGYAETSPSLILKLNPGQPSSRTTVFEDQGGFLSAATVAVQYENLMLIGSVQDDHIAVCRISQ